MKSQKPPSKTKDAEGTPKQLSMSPQAYFEILQGITLETLFLEDCAAHVKREKLESLRELSYSWDEEVSWEMKSPNLFVAKHVYKLIAPSKAKRDFALMISGTFALGYSSRKELSQQFLEVFSDHNISLNTWPYFRELVQSMTQRMNVPALVLPLIT